MPGVHELFLLLSGRRGRRGQLWKFVDADGRLTVYDYNAVGQETYEYEYASTTATTPYSTIAYAYNSEGQVLSASDTAATGTAADSYSYDDTGNVTSEAQQLPGLTPAVALRSQYTDGDRTQLSAAIGVGVDTATGVASGGTSDFVNTYRYGGPLGEMSQVVQQGVGVASKSAAFGYDEDGQAATLDLYQSASVGTNRVANAKYQYNEDGQLTSINYTDGSGNPLDHLTWKYDTQGDVWQSQSSRDSGAVTYNFSSIPAISGPWKASYRASYCVILYP